MNVGGMKLEITEGKNEGRNEWGRNETRKKGESEGRKE